MSRPLRDIADHLKICVIGIGNEHRGDDAIGLLVARKLMEKSISSATVIELDGETTNLIDAMKNKSAAILVDAMQSGSGVGAVSRFDAGTDPLPMNFFRCSTHLISVGETVELARALGHLPKYVIVYGIEGARFEPGSDLSAEVVSALNKVVEQVSDEIQTLQTKRS